MIWAVYAMACALFYAAFTRLGVVARTRALMELLHASSRVMTDTALSDRTKEARIRQAALRALGRKLDLVGRLLVVAGLAAAPILAAGHVFGLDAGAVVALSLDPVILVVTVLGLGVVEVTRRRLQG